MFGRSRKRSQEPGSPAGKLRFSAHLIHTLTFPLRAFSSRPTAVAAVPLGVSSHSRRYLSPEEAARQELLAFLATLCSNENVGRIRSTSGLVESATSTNLMASSSESLDDSGLGGPTSLPSQVDEASFLELITTFARRRLVACAQRPRNAAPMRARARARWPSLSHRRIPAPTRN